MPRDKLSSHERVLAAARAEFMEHGFERASMRRIGQRCGMTAAGLYRHCVDKAGLFSELVEPAARKLNDWLDARLRETGTFSAADMMRELIYPHMEDYRLLLTRSQGTKYECFLHELVARRAQELPPSSPPLDNKALHLLMIAYMTALFEPVIGGYTEEEAVRCLEIAEEFFLPCWERLLHA